MAGGEVDLAWNGLALRVPKGWEPGVVEKRYLRLDSEDGPVLEAKWTPVKGRFSLKKHVAKVAREARKHRRKLSSDSGMCGEWSRVRDILEAKGFQAAPFVWSGTGGRDIGGRGVVAYCPECRTATLLQFLAGDAGVEVGAALDIAASYQDHHGAEGVPWRVYDLKARIPGHYALHRFSFTAGQYVLEFLDTGRGAGGGVILERIVPADVILRDKSLEEWAEFRYEELLSGGGANPEDKGPVTAEWRGAEAVGWERRQGRGGLKRGSVVRLGRAWLPRSANRILCVRMLARLRGEAALTRNAFESICSAYEVV